MRGAFPVERWSERLTAAWFGPKGFASIVFALLVVHSGIGGGERLFNLAGLVIVASILLHSSTDVPIARWFRKQQAAET